ncbi:MAG: hypothetical protein CSA95_08295 [Bacteroidetes bacterium]|nr:MAG: hypothetical protein CSA95_08295 [Bacteroidota bacterium]
MEVFARNLHQLLKKEGITPEQLAAQADIKPADIQAALNAEAPLRPSELLRLSHRLQSGLSALFTHKETLHNDFDCKMLALDIDGVMTDGGMVVHSDKTESKRFNTKDGMAIKQLLKQGIEVGFISSGKNHDLVQYRADMLGVKRVWVGSGEKLEVLTRWCKEMGISLSQVAFIGDDINDREVLKQVGLSACPADAVPVIRDLCSHILTRNGGDACVRELVEYMGFLKG